MTYHHQQKGVVIVVIRDCFKILPFVVMQHIAWVCQQQLSNLFKKLQPTYAIFRFFKLTAANSMDF